MAKVDLQFRLTGAIIPVDHGYPLFSAITGILPEIHGDRDIGVHPINGRLIGNRLMALTERSRLTLRIPADRISSLLALAGKTLRIAGRHIRIGVPRVRPLVPRPCLYSRLVIIKGFMEPADFLEAVTDRLRTMNVRGDPVLIRQSSMSQGNTGGHIGTRSPVLRRTIRIKTKEIVGFAVLVRNLPAKDSILLQEEGVGGRRRFGCGVFIPAGGNQGGLSGT